MQIIILSQQIANMERAQGSIKKTSQNKGLFLPKKCKQALKLKVNATSSPTKITGGMAMWKFKTECPDNVCLVKLVMVNGDCS